MFSDNVINDRFHKPFLEIQRCLYPFKGKSQQPVTHRLRQPRDKALHYDIKLAVIKQVLEGLLHLLRLIRPNLVKLLQRTLLHSGSKL